MRFLLLSLPLLPLDLQFLGLSQAKDLARFAGKLRRSLPLGLIAFVVAVARRFIAAIAIAIIAIIATARGTAFVGHVPHLVAVPVLSRVSLSFILFVVTLFELLL